MPQVSEGQNIRQAYIDLVSVTASLHDITVAIEEAS